MPTTTATSRQSTSGSALKRARRATSTSSERKVHKRKDRRARRHAFLLFFSCAASLRLAWFTGELRIEGLIHEPSSFHGDQITRTDQANTLADDVQTSCSWLQHDTLHGVSFIHHAGDTLQDRIMQIILAQHSVKGAVSPVMGQSHAGNIKRLCPFEQGFLPRRDKQEFSIPVNVFRDQPGAGHAVHAHLLPGDPFHDANPPLTSHKRGVAETWRSGFQVPPLALISRSRTCMPTSE